MREIVEPTLAGMRARGTPFVGVLYAGLMITADGPKLIEYNVRFGDPECQVLMPRLKSDLVAALLAACDGVLEKLRRALVGRGGADRGDGRAGLSRRCRARLRDPRHRRGRGARGRARLPRRHAARMAAASSPRAGACSASRRRARRSPRRRARAYAAVARIDWPQGFCRRDIGWRAVERTREG